MSLLLRNVFSRFPRLLERDDGFRCQSRFFAVLGCMVPPLSWLLISPRVQYKLICWVMRKLTQAPDNPGEEDKYQSNLKCRTYGTGCSSIPARRAREGAFFIGRVGLVSRDT